MKIEREKEREIVFGYYTQVTYHPYKSLREREKERERNKEREKEREGERDRK